jgi:hypothetical protein
MPARSAIRRRVGALAAAVLIVALAACTATGGPHCDDLYRQGGKHAGPLGENA